ncbi:TPA: hypothetical protein DDW35_13785, partial [Candidatus Sumerlaeota bacterium]|nr:hypothetical protein [Candidatus Sumerlaeota bacterium]
ARQIDPLGRQFADLIAAVSRMNQDYYRSISPDDDTPGIIDMEERFELLSQWELLNIHMEALREKIMGGDAEPLAAELERIGRETKEDLSHREIEVLKIVALGRSNMEVAKELHISSKTVEVHKSSLVRKITDILGRRPEAAELSKCAFLAGKMGNREWLSDLVRKPE